MLFVFVVQAFFLDLAALVHGVRGAQDAAALAQCFEFLAHCLFHHVGEAVHGEAALPGVFLEVEARLIVDDHLHGDGAADAFFGGDGDRFVIGICVQVVEERCASDLVFTHSGEFLQLFTSKICIRVGPRPCRSARGLRNL